MKPEGIENMPAGPEMDALVAQKVMAWDLSANRIYPNLQDDFNCDFRPLSSFQPSTDIAAGWQVVEQMQSLGYWCQARTPFGPPGSKGCDGCWAGFTPHLTTGWNGRPDGWTHAETLPLAICRAALLALTQENEK